MEHVDDRPHLQLGPNTIATQRPRSSTSTSTKSKRRPQSRASTTSIHSVNTQGSQQHDGLSNYSQQPQPQMHHHQLQPNENFAYTPESMIMQSAHNLTNPHGLAIDPALGGQHNQYQPYNNDPQYHSHVTQDQSIQPFPKFDGPEGHLLDTMQNDRAQATPDPDAEADGKATKSRSSASFQNDLELRKLFRENETKTLEQIAAQLLGNERGPNSEKIRQTFAMVWLNTSCKKSSGSVPRGRVYSYYVTRCGKERVGVLNPASFGKLVRVMFPGIQTRRLGMRGESKYHYCGLSLVELPEEQSSSNGHTSTATVPSQQDFGNDRFENTSSKFQLPMDTAAFPTPGMIQGSSTSRIRQPAAFGRLFYDASSNLDLNDHTTIIDRELKFSSTPDVSFSDKEPIHLPSINPYLPPGTDLDTSAALTALYGTHCTSLIDCIRFCREKQFLHFFTSFHGTLTVPVQKLLAQPSIAPWITECDWLMYQKMIRVVAPLTLQVVPQGVMNFFRMISERLGAHIKASFQSHPEHVIKAKLGPATIFASLLDRLLRVNLTAHAAANMLCNSANRDIMYEEWLAYVQPVKIVQSELPGSGYRKVLHILNNEIRELLSPLSLNWDPNNSDFNASANPHAHPLPESTETALDRWTAFLSSLQTRFPRTNTRTIIQVLNSVSSACLRDLTMNGGRSFGSWWITKTWLDEMVLWLAEKGGFMDHIPGQYPLPSKTNDDSMVIDPTFDATTSRSHGHRSSNGSVSNGASRYSSVSGDFGPPTGRFDTRSHSTAIGANYTEPPPKQQAPSTTVLPIIDTGSTTALVTASNFTKDMGNEQHDDSGVGMNLGEEDIEMHKFGFGPTASAHGIEGDRGTSDDVVVC